MLMTKTRTKWHRKQGAHRLDALGVGRQRDTGATRRGRGHLTGSGMKEEESQAKYAML